MVNGNFSAGQTGWVFTGNVGVFDSTDYDTCCATGDTGTGNFVAFGGSDGADNGQITQTIATVLGQEYSLTFQYGAFSSPAGRGTQSVTVDAGSLNTTLTSATSARDLSAVFSSYEYEFTATGATTTLSFADASTATDSIDGFLDTIDVEAVPAVPEPSSWTLVGTGFTCLCAMYRKRKQLHRSR